ncbi:ubiquitin-specific protease ubp2 [Sporothrix epigloea]|uniref:ubiquitinyl hydrolase 1 n=1 Tax=Sporothrix epigloea TaxID=1892477 RepID=A0ABP0D8H2_9PEZI
MNSVAYSKAPPHPVTSGQQQVVGETTHLELCKAGRLAPKWLEDFISGELDDELDEDNDQRNDILHVGCATLEFRREMAKQSGTSHINEAGPRIIRHELLLKGHQSLQDEKEQVATQHPCRADGRECDEVLACVCQNCRYHFTIYVDRKKEHLCGTLRGNKKDPFHHLVRVYTNTTVPSSIDAKFYPYHALAKFACSAERCDYNISVEITSPRLNDRLLGFLRNDDAIRSRLKRAIEEEPERFADVANATPNALAYLRAYLRDIVDEKREKNADGTVIERKIDQRNKKFYVQFGNGPEAAELLTYLGFEEVVGEDSRSWKVPSPPFTRPTRPGSQLAFYQDVKSEVETIIGKDSQNLKPNTAFSFIMSALDIGAYFTTEHKESDILALYQAYDFANLGLTPVMHEMYLWYAYTCQHQVKPKDENKFFESLKRLAVGRDNEDLEMRVQSSASMRTTQPQVPEAESQEEDEIRRATELSLQDVQPQSTKHELSSDTSVTQAYNYFGLAEGQRSDDEVLGKFVSTAEAYPSQKTSLREKLLLIARHTNSVALEEFATKDMTPEESMQYLGVQHDTEAAFIVNICQYHCNSGEKDYALVAAALEVIGQERDNDAVLLSAAQDLSGNHDRGGKSYMTELGQMDVDPSFTHPQAVDISLPVGLDNIRNTCYLNSILQYLYTVKPIHAILDNIEEVGLPDTDASLESRRIDPGSSHLEKGEAYAGRKFVEEMASLYKDMQQCPKSSLRPQQRLAIAALKNSASLEQDGEKLLSKEAEDQDHAVTFNMASLSRPGTPAPPLPFRHTPASLAVAAQNTTVHVDSPSSPHTSTFVAASDTEFLDLASVQSSQTLVMEENRAGQVDVSRPLVSQMSVSMAEVQEDEDDYDRPKAEHAEQTRGTIAPPSYETAMSGVCSNDSMGDVAENDMQPMFDPPPRTEATVEEKIDRALNDSSVTGTDQQDVEEVMGNIISHLRAAVRSTGMDEVTAVQRDHITDTFFWTSATYSRSEQKGRYNKQVSPNRWVTAFPAETQKIHLLQALSSSFQREFITQGTWYERFTSIVNLPPILHIHIQRSKGDGTKIRTPVAIPEILHLDQFMDCEEGSELFSRRRHAWNLQERIRSLKGPSGELADFYFSPEAMDNATRYTNVVADEYLKASVDTNDSSVTGEDRQVADGDTTLCDEVNILEDDSDDDGYVVISKELQEMMDAAGVVPPVILEEKARKAEAEKEVDASNGRYCNSEASRLFLDEARNMTLDEMRQAWTRQDLADRSNQMMQTLNETKQKYEQELESLFEDLKDPRNEYRLHAVVCHSGNTGTGGHYWVWVYDFERSIWRKYNDSVVQEEPDPAQVLETLSNQGEPYYLAYVRASDVENFVSVPLRHNLVQQATEVARSGTPSPPPRPHHDSGQEGKSGEGSSETSAPKSTPLTDDVSTGTTLAESRPSHAMPDRPATPPLEEIKAQTSATKDSTLASHPKDSFAPLPGPPLTPERDCDVQQDVIIARETPQQSRLPGESQLDKRPSGVLLSPRDANGSRSLSNTDADV